MSRESNTVREGLVLGGSAFVAVVFFYAAFDSLAARGPLFTVDLLGKALFRGLRDPAVLQLPGQVDFTVVVLYTAFHLAASLAIGLVVAWLLGHAGTGGGRAVAVRTVLIAGFFVTVALVGVLTVPMRALLPTWSIVAANALAVAVAGAALMRVRPQVFADVFGLERAG